jgi:hypothetical protein
MIFLLNVFFGISLLGNLIVLSIFRHRKRVDGVLDSYVYKY